MTAEKAKPGKAKKKKADDGDAPQRLQPPGSVGEILQTTRAQRGISLEDVSSSINIRVVQLRALESGDIDALPGMTYALGFVKSYAAFLKLDSAGIVQKFKAEHGNLLPANQLHFPEPIADGPQPDFLIIGAAAFCAVLIIVLWAVFSGGSDKAADIAEQIPDAPAVGTMTGITQTPAAAPPTSLTGLNLLESAAPVSAPSEPVAETAPEPAAPAASAAAPEPAPAAKTAPPVEETAPVINVKRGKSRVTLVSQRASWVEIRNAEGKVVLKKVLRPGDSFSVPDEKGLALVTTNAGGLDVIVDGQEVQPLGVPGEIVRGVSLDAEALKRVRTRARN